MRGWTRGTVAVLATVLLTNVLTSLTNAGAEADQDAQPASAVGKPGTWDDGVMADPSMGMPTSISCIDPGFCLAGDEHGAVIRYRDGRWHAPSYPGGDRRFDEVSCLSKSFCVAIGGMYQWSSASVYDGKAWSAPESLDMDEPRSVSCTSETFCLAVGRRESQVFDGSAWSAAQPNGGGGDADCVSASFCVSAGYGGLIHQWDGSRWASTKVEGYDAASAVSCASTTWCVVLDQYGGGLTTYDGTAWKHDDSVQSDHDWRDVSCSSENFCVASAGGAGTFIFNGRKWAPASGARGNLDAVSCSADRQCMAVSLDDYAMRFDDGRWHRRVPIDTGTGWPLDVSCPMATFCMLVDYHGMAVRFANGRWRSAQPVLGDHLPLYAVSCASETYCAALGKAGAVTYSATGWSAAVPLGIGPTQDVSCPSVTFCMVLGRGGGVAAFDGTQWGTLSSVGDGEVWRALSCVSASFCVALSVAGEAALYDGSTWTEPTRILTRGGSSVSCSSESFCMALADNHQFSVYDGSTWTRTRIEASALASVSCPSDGVCMTVTAFGYARLYTDGAWVRWNVSAQSDELEQLSCPTPTKCVSTVQSSGLVFTYQGT